MSEPWVERHRPRSLEEVVGNTSAVESLRRWAKAWQEGRPKEKAAILVGPPGCGKTSAAHALAAEFGWELVELNASDARSAPAIQRVAGVGSVHQTFTSAGEYHSTKHGQRKLILLDEADNLYERSAEAQDAAGQDYSDRGGRRAIVDTVLATHQPVVLIVNDAYELLRGSGDRLKRVALRIPFRRLPSPSVRKLLREVARREGVEVAEPVLEAIAEGAHGDLRCALNDLEAAAAGRKRLESLEGLELGGRDRGETAFNVVASILKSTDYRRAVEAARDLDEPPDFLLAWLDENVPNEYREPADLVRAYEELSRADVFLGRTLRRQQFRLWGYATELLAGGVAAAKAQRYGTPPNYRFPGWILHMSGSKGARGVRSRLGEKVGAYLHVGVRAFVRDVLPDLQRACGRDAALGEAVSLRCDLEEDEIRMLVGPDAPEAYADEVVAHVEHRRAEQVRPQGELPVHQDSAPHKDAKASRHRGTRLGDF